MDTVQQGDYQLEVGEDRLSIRQRVNGSIDRVFACLTQPEKLAQWHAPGEMTVPDVAVDLQVGGAYHITMENADKETFTAYGHYREISQPDHSGTARLVYSWAWRHVDEGPETVVTILLRADGEQTDVELIHEGFPAADVAQHHSQGWGKIFINLARFCN